MTTGNELRFGVALDIAGRKLRVELYADGTALCTACQGGDCEHVQYARRLRDQPATVALERILETWITSGAWINLEARVEWGTTALRIAQEGHEAQKQADQRAVYVQWRDTDPRTRDELVADACAMFSTPGAASTPIEREWGMTPGHTTPGDIQTRHLGAGSTYDHAIHQEP